MHYLPKLLNHYKFFLPLASLNPNPNTSASVANKIDRFLYRGTCAIQSLINMRYSLTESEKLGLEYIKQLSFNSKNRVPFSCSELFLAYAQIPGTLSSIVILQNQILRLISAITKQGQNIPKSMNDAFKKGIEKIGFNNEINTLLYNYWNNGGKYIREVRNVNEHFDALVDYTFLEFKENRGKILIFLPDNPEIKSPKKFTYQKELDAYFTLYNGLQSLNELVNSICKLENIQDGQFKPSVIVNHVANLDSKKELTLGVFVSVEEIKDGVKGLHAMELKQTLKSENNSPEIEFRNLKPDRYVK